MKSGLLKFRFIRTLLIIIFLAEITGCASKSFQFKDVEPVRYFNDIHPIPYPGSIRDDKFDYYANVLPKLPIVKNLDMSRNKNARDVNSFDEVPASSWFFPRLGYENISPEELVAGPGKSGPPQPPITVIRVRKPDENPRLFVYDTRQIYYLLKFDPPDYPDIATTSSFLVNRLFWGFGYHVPEDHSFFFKREDIKVSAEIKLTDQDMDRILDRAAKSAEGVYRSIASRILEGLPLGPIPEKGVRADDPNDWFDHEDRRVLRGLRMFCAFTNMSDFSADNTLDMYVGEEGKGYIKHHIIDFDDAFGTHAARQNRLWAGYNHQFSFGDVMKNFISAGLIVEDWEKLKNSPWKSVGSFESTYFNPNDWKETHPYGPIGRSQPADEYWAAKIVGALTPEHIEVLVNAADYPEPEAEKFVIKSLVKRREKILQFCLNKVSPIEFLKLENEQLFLKDLGKLLLNRYFTDRSYEIHFYNDHIEEIRDKMIIKTDSAFFHIPVTNFLMEKANDYLRIDVLVSEGKNKGVSPAQFHLKRRKDLTIRLVGIVH